MNDGRISTDIVDETIFREQAGIIEQDPRADPEGWFLGKVDIIFALEKLPEIINAGANDKQTTQRIGYCLEARFLHKENIDDADQRKGHQAIEQNAFCVRAADDHPHEINIETKGNDG